MQSKLFIENIFTIIDLFRKYTSCDKSIKYTFKTLEIRFLRIMQVTSDLQMKLYIAN
jgi:hypothetical protein